MSRQKIGAVLVIIGVWLQLCMLCATIVQREPRLKYWPVTLAVVVTMVGIVLAGIASRPWLVRWRLLWRLPWRPVPLSSLVSLNTLIWLSDLNHRSCSTTFDMQPLSCRLFPFELLATTVLILTGVLLNRIKKVKGPHPTPASGH